MCSSYFSITIRKFWGNALFCGYKKKNWLGLLFLASSCMIGLSARADTTELEVYRTEIADPGEINFDLAGNIITAARHSDLVGRTITQAVGELSYGLASEWQVALKLPLSYTNGDWYGNGLLGEVKYVAPHQKEGFYWGAEVELGYLSTFDENEKWGVDAVPILGYRMPSWEFTINPGLSITSGGDQRNVVMFEPSAKIAYQLNRDNAVGVEYFSESGAVSAILPSGRRNDLAFLALDTKVAKSLVTFGVGQGLNSRSPKLALKLVADIEFD